MGRGKSSVARKETFIAPWRAIREPFDVGLLHPSRKEFPGACITHRPMTARLDPQRTALAVIDMQEAFRAVIPDFTVVAERIGKAVQGATLMGLPVLVTEQYPRGLKHTAAEIQ